MTGLRTQRALFLVECLDLEAASQFEGAKWEHFQLAHLTDDGLFRIERKSRQIAWSWLCAAEAVASAILDAETSIFVSINQDEAKEKVRYAKRVYESLQGVQIPRITRDNDLGIELDNGARLLSLPARPPRGKARANVYLDEFAHVALDQKIYTAVLPVVSKGGRLRIGSSPLGASGVFWEVFSQSIRQYPGFTRKSTPWWEIQSFCVDVRTARRDAPTLPTRERVARFGNERIQAICSNMLEEDFRQEYEADFVDETTAWISWEELRAVQDADLLCTLATGQGTGVDALHEAIDRVASQVHTGQIEQAFGAGMDIGRTRNTSEIYVGGMSPGGNVPLRLALTLDAMPFDSQLEVASHALRDLPIATQLIDRNGLGMNLAESLERDFPGRAQGVDFTNGTKTLWAKNAKMLVQQRRCPIPADRDMAYQIHSIKKLVTPSKNLVFDTARNEKHHADKFWAWALMLTAASTEPQVPDQTLVLADRVEISAF